MRKLLFRYFLICLSIMSFQFSYAQEELVPMSKNPHLPKPTKIVNPKGSQDALKLPFFDDFSGTDLHLQSSHWSDNDVFVNRTYSIASPTLGVATFDAVDMYGVVYSYATQNSAVMDYLTSNEIRLDSIFSGIAHKTTLSDSIYLSFYIQPGGIGDAPETADSIVLQLFNSNIQDWVSVWNHEGLSLDSFESKYGAKFLQVMIAIKDTSYYKSDFRFRFLNYASIPNAVVPSWRSGLYDFWHLDYVYIDGGRSAADKHIDDVVIVSSINSLLKNYVSMPWNQYKINPTVEMDYTKSIETYNLDAVTPSKNINRYFSILSKFDNVLWKTIPYPNTMNMGPLATQIFAPNYNSYTFTSTAPKYSDFMVVYSIENSTPPLDFNRKNDTLLFFQKFYNYYAYDDGFPESGYGLSAAHSKTAVKFVLNTPDSLQSIDMYFNQTLGNANQQYFDLIIWADIGGKPGTELYRKSGKRPEFESDLFKFYTYKLDKAIYVSGTFYVGMEQVTNNNLNIGFDLNNDHKSQILYNVSGTWVNTSYAGSLMIRPILGADNQAFVGNIQNEFPPITQVKIFPNPLNSNTLFVSLKEDENPDNYSIEIYSMTSQRVYSSPLSNEIELSDLPNGLYFVKITNLNTQQNTTHKLVITR